MDRRGRGLRRDPATEVAQRLFFRLHFFFCRRGRALRPLLALRLRRRRRLDRGRDAGAAQGRDGEQVIGIGRVGPGVEDAGALPQGLRCEDHPDLAGGAERRGRAGDHRRAVLLDDDEVGRIRAYRGRVGVRPEAAVRRVRRVSVACDLQREGNRRTLRPESLRRERRRLRRDIWHRRRGRGPDERRDDCDGGSAEAHGVQVWTVHPTLRRSFRSFPLRSARARLACIT